MTSRHRHNAGTAISHCQPPTQALLHTPLKHDAVFTVCMIYLSAGNYSLGIGSMLQSEAEKLLSR
jgi:hypothetical protein